MFKKACNYQDADLGWIWVCFDILCVKLHIIMATDQLVPTQIEVESKRFFWTVVYASNTSMERRSLWDRIEYISSGMERICKRLGGQEPMNPDENFKNCIENVGLVEVHMKGYFLTWTNNQAEENRIWQRLDRCMAMPANISYHSSLIIRLLGVVNSRNVPFRFFNMWVSHPEYDGIMARVWQEERRGNVNIKLQCKLKELKRKLKRLNRREFSDISGKVDNCRQVMEQLQESLQSNLMNPVLLDEERAVMSYFRNLLK
ncbi:hypothetical protein MANES_16G057626v8 [Manihot esculenta]|uniref:Uncharacterized protein n=1 Tax=Manihot esculenta TaxID=3983 RepID=A0ACB7G5V1_MANES|nr:hypothetical protein MANES_16G057626v8 [Manihot esculenta]